MPDVDANLAVNPDIRERAAKVATACVNDAKRSRTNLQRVWKECEDLWNRRSISEVFPRGEVKHVPEPYNRAEVIQPRFYRGVFGVQRWFAVEARKPETRRFEDSIYALLHWQMQDNDWQFFTDQDDGIREVVIYGTVFFKCYWQKEIRQVTDREMVAKTVKSADGEIIAETVTPGPLKNEEKEYGYPRAESWNVRQVYVDRHVNSLRDARYIGNEFQKTINEVKVLAADGTYTNCEDLLKKREESIQRMRAGRDLPKHLNNIKFVEMWTAMELDGKVVPVVITQTLDGGPAAMDQKRQGIVVRVERNNFPGGLRPYAVGHYIKRPGEIYGVGALAPVRDLSKELDEWRTMSLRAQELAIAPPLIAQDEMTLDAEQCFLYPGRVFYSRTGKDGISPMTLPSNQMSTYHIERVIRQDIAQTTKSPEAFMGASAGGRQTAYEVQSQNQESGLSLSQIIARYRIEVLKPILRNWLALDAMHIEKDVCIRVAGASAVKNPLMTIKPEIIQLQYEFEILDTAEVAMMGNKSRQIISLFQALTPELSALIKGDRVLEVFFKSIGEEDAKDYIHMQLDDRDLLSPAEEMQMIVANEEPPVEEGLPMQYLMFHVASHQMQFGSPEFYGKLTPQQKIFFQRHMQATVAALQKAQQRLVAQQQQMQAASEQRGGRQRQGRPETQTGALQRAAGVNQGV